MSRLIRLQTYYNITAFGAKTKGGGNLKPTDLWELESDINSPGETFPSWASTSIEMRKKLLNKK